MQFPRALIALTLIRMANHDPYGQQPRPLLVGT